MTNLIQTPEIKAFRAAVRPYLMTKQKKGEEYVIVLNAPAGTGKSEQLREIQEETPWCYTVASTGKAAQGVKGKTLHSFAGIPLFEDGTIYDRDKPLGFGVGKWAKGQLAQEECITPRAKASPLLAKTKVLLVDESSMITAWDLDCLEARCRQAKNSKKPFGGIKVIFFMDCFQLQPVVSRKNGLAAIKLGYSKRAIMTPEEAKESGWKEGDKIWPTKLVPAIDMWEAKCLKG